MLACLVYAVRRRTRAHVVLGRRSVDVVATFAPAMADGRAESKPPCTAIFCRCMVFWEGNTPHRVVRALTTDADLLHGNHWIIAVQNTGMVVASSKGSLLRPHKPCRGHRCGKPGGSFMSPLQEYVRPLGYILLPTVEQGDCGIDAMAFWDGAPAHRDNMEGPA